MNWSAARCGYELPALSGFNFVMDQALEGVNESLNLDGHGKSELFVGVEIEL